MFGGVIQRRRAIYRAARDHRLLRLFSGYLGDETGDGLAGAICLRICAPVEPGSMILLALLVHMVAGLSRITVYPLWSRCGIDMMTVVSLRRSGCQYNTALSPFACEY